MIPIKIYGVVEIIDLPRIINPYIGGYKNHLISEFYIESFEYPGFFQIIAS